VGLLSGDAKGKKKKAKRRPKKKRRGRVALVETLAEREGTRDDRTTVVLSIL